MSNFRWRISILFVSLVLAALWGCSSSNDNVIGDPLQPRVLGRATLDAPFSNATITVMTEDGTVLHEQKADLSGTFRLNVPSGTAPPWRLRARGTPAGFDREVVLFADLEELPLVGMVHLNPLTDLASRLRQQQPDLSVADSEVLLRRLLGLHPQFQLKHVHGRGGVQSGFYLPRYLDQLQAEPGLQDFLTQQALLLQQGGDSPLRPFVPPDEAEKIEDYAAELAISSVFNVGQLAGLAEGPEIPEPLKKLISTGILQILSGGTLGKDPVIEGLEVISQELLAVYDEIAALGKSLDRDFQQAEIEAKQNILQPFLDQIDTARGTFNTFSKEKPIDPARLELALQGASGLGDAVQEIAKTLINDQPDGEGLLDLFSKVQRFPGRFYRNRLVQSQSSSDPGEAGEVDGIEKIVQYDPLVQAFQYYAAYQTVAFALHQNALLGLWQSSPDVGIQPDVALASFQTFSKNLTRQLQRIPYGPLPDDRMIYDAELGVIWYYQAISPSTYRDMLNFLVAFSASNALNGGPTWSLPSQSDLDALFQQTSAQDLTRSGFDLSAVLAAEHPYLWVQSVMEETYDPRFVYQIDPTGDAPSGSLVEWDFVDNQSPLAFLLVSRQLWIDGQLQIAEAIGATTNLRAEHDLGENDIQFTAYGWMENAFGGLKVDLTDRVLWEVSDNAIATISNYPSSDVSGTLFTAQVLQQLPAPVLAGLKSMAGRKPGNLRWLQSGPQTVSVTGRYYDPVSQTETTIGPYEVSMDAPEPNLTSLLLAQETTVVSQLPASIELALWGYFDNATVEELTKDPGTTITWNIKGQPVTGATVTDGKLVITTLPAGSKLELTATVNGITSPSTETTFQP